MARAVTNTDWTGATDSIWGDANWDNGVPTTGYQAQFNSAGNGNTSISLGGGTQAINTILFSGSNGTLASYNLGGTNDTFIFDASGAITVSTNTATVTSQTITANIQTLGNFTITNNDTNTTAAGLTINGNIALTGNATNALTISAAANTYTLINGNITGTGSAGITWSSNGTIRFTGQSTYSGVTNLTSGNNTIIQIGSSSVMSGASIVSGPFGTGIALANSSTNSFFEAVGGDQTVANPINMLFGMTVLSAPTSGANADPLAGVHNLTFSGPITMGTAGRTLALNFSGTNSLSIGGTSASTWTLPTSSNQTTTIAMSNAANLFLNDVIQDASATAVGTLAIVATPATGGGGVIIFNDASTFSDAITVSSGANGSQQVWELPISSVVSGGNIVSGPFGKGTITLSTNSNTPIILEPINGNQTIANTINATGAGFFATDAGTNLRSLTLSGPISVNGHTYTDNINLGSSEIWGLAGTNASTLSLSGLVTLQANNAVVGNSFIFNDLISGTGSFLSKAGLSVTLANASNSFTGGFQIEGGSTVNINADSDLGAGTSSVTIGPSIANGNLISSGSFTSASRPIILSGTGTDLIDVTGTNVVTLNGIVSGSTSQGLTKGANTGTLVLGNASNSYLNGTSIDGGTLSVSADGDLGNSSGPVYLNAGYFNTGVSGTLLSTGTFTSARTINLNGASNIIDATGTNVLTLTGSFGGSGDLTKGTNSGTLQLAQSGGFSIGGNINVNGGTLLVGPTGGETGPLSVGNTLTVNSGALAAIATGVSSNNVTNSVSTLTLNGSGQFDLANSYLITSTPSNTIRQYLINGYNGGAWNGTGGISSVNANASYNIPASNGGHFTALGYSSGTTIAALGLTAGQTYVRYTIYGDANLDGTVDINDLNIVLSNFLSGNPGTWDTGDFYYAGQTDISDLNAVLSNFFDSAPTTVRAANAAAKFKASTASTAKTLTGTVSPADTVNPPPANGVLELVVDTVTGDVELEGNNADIASLQITSASSGIITANWTDLHANGYTNWSDTAKKKTGIGEYDNQFTATGDYAVLGVVDYGDIYNTTVNAEDYVFKYGSVESNDTTVDTDTGSVIYVQPVPEPTTLGLMGLAAAGLMGRRRKSKQPR